MLDLFDQYRRGVSPGGRIYFLHGISVRIINFCRQMSVSTNDKLSCGLDDHCPHIQSRLLLWNPTENNDGLVSFVTPWFLFFLYVHFLFRSDGTAVQREDNQLQTWSRRRVADTCERKTFKYDRSTICVMLSVDWHTSLIISLIEIGHRTRISVSSFQAKPTKKKKDGLRKWISD